MEPSSTLLADKGRRIGIGTRPRLTKRETKDYVDYLSATSHPKPSQKGWNGEKGGLQFFIAWFNARFSKWVGKIIRSLHSGPDAIVRPFVPAIFQFIIQGLGNS